jgi:hypothetical protein
MIRDISRVTCAWLEIILTGCSRKPAAVSFASLAGKLADENSKHESTQRARGALQDASARAASYKLQKFNVSYTISPLLTHDSWQRVSSQVAILNQNQSINVVKPFLLRYR